MVGEDDLPGQWDDELSGWPEERRHLAGKRIAFVTVCGVLITLIFLTIIFVGKDKTSAARVSANGTSTSTVTTVGFATSLPVAATATSFATTTSSSTTSTTFAGRNISTTTTSTTTTTLPRYFLNPNPRSAQVPNNTYNPTGCIQSDEPFTFNAPSPGGTLSITRNNGITASGQINADGSFDIRSSNGATVDRYVGQIDAAQTQAAGTYRRTDNSPCGGVTIKATWTFK